MKEIIELTCIGCPMGCCLTVTLEDESVLKVEGHSCNKGIRYAQKECTNPTRIVTSSVKVNDGEIRVVSIKTQEDIPKDKMLDCIKELKNVKVQAPISEGDIIIRNIAGTNVNVVATKNVGYMA